MPYRTISAPTAGPGGAADKGDPFSWSRRRPCSSTSRKHPTDHASPAHQPQPVPRSFVSVMMPLWLWYPWLGLRMIALPLEAIGCHPVGDALWREDRSTGTFAPCA